MGVLDDYDDALDKVYSGTAGDSLDPTLPSHTQIDLDEDGQPVLARFTYVDENTCIGCKNCALVARSTFLMEDDLGKARVFAQGGDSDDLIAEAIDSCPVNCIHFVSHEDLVTLETERVERENSVTINNYGNFKSAWVGGTHAPPETKAAFYNNAKLGARCTNCPSRGCKECPMFGVGSNPVYMQRVAERDAKREASGEAREERERIEREAMVGTLVSDSHTTSPSNADTPSPNADAPVSNTETSSTPIV